MFMESFKNDCLTIYMAFIMTHGLVYEW